MPRGDETRFEVLVVDVGGSFEVTITDSEGGEYAKTQAPHVDLALQMAVPYMAGMAQPHPFASLLREAGGA